MLKRDSFCYIGGKTEFTDSAGQLEIRDMRCKHVCSLESFKAQELLRASESIGYRQCMWGEGEGYRKHTELNQTVNRSRIQLYIYDKFIHPVRVVADEEGILWIDNLHSAIAQVISRGDDCTLGEIPHYIIRHNEESGWTEVYDPYKVVDLNKLHGALTSADMRLSRVDRNVRNVHYTIGEFMKENNMDREHMTLSFKYYDDFNDTTDRIVTDRTGGNSGYEEKQWNNRNEIQDGYGPNGCRDGRDICGNPSGRSIFRKSKRDPHPRSED